MGQKEVIFLVIITLTSSQPQRQVDCSSYLNCMSCTSSIFQPASSPKCKWENNKCQSYPDGYIVMYNDKNWYEYFTPCSSDPLSISVMDTYTGGNRNNDILPDIIDFYPVNSEYVPSNFYSEWTKLFQLKQSSTLLFEFYRQTQDLSDKILLLFKLKTHNEFYPITDLQDKAILAKNLQKFQLFYFSSNSKQKSPFTLQISLYKSQVQKIYIILTIIIVILIGISLLILLIKYIKKRIEMSRYSSTPYNGNNNIVIQPIDANNSAHIIGQYRIRESNVNEMAVLNKEKTLSEKDLVPMEYTKEINIYNDNCTICLESFTNKEKVVVFSCKHIFHYECIKTNFLNKVFKCPNCNVSLKRDDVVTYKNIQAI